MRNIACKSAGYVSWDGYAQDTMTTEPHHILDNHLVNIDKTTLGRSR